MRPSTVVELAAKAGQALPTQRVEDLYRYDSLDSFLSVFWFVQSLLRTPADWERLAYESLVDGAAHGVRYREMFFTPARHLAAGADLGAIIDGLDRGLSAAEAATGARCALILEMDRAFGAQAGLELVDALIELQAAGEAERVIGVGMDSTELGVDLASYAPAFARARRAGLRRTGHCGEAVGVGAGNIRIALDACGIERIDHGVAILEDPVLVERVAGDRIPLTVCPTSNVVIANRYPDLASQPFRQMRDAGLLATLNTDDPAMTELDLGREYRDVALAQGLDRDAVLAVALDGIEGSWLDVVDRRALRTAFDEHIAGLVGDRRED